VVCTFKMSIARSTNLEHGKAHVIAIVRDTKLQS
jgi:hypothetical protein